MAIGEVGTLTRGNFGNREVIRIDFSEPLENAVIHLSSTNDGGNEFSLRVLSVDSTGFTFSLEEFEDHDGPHPVIETINWIAVEAGVHTLADGRVIEAGTTTATTTSSNVTLNGSFNDAPVVLTNVMSRNDPDVVDSDPLNIDASGFDVRLQEGSLVDGVNTGETVGYIAISAGGDGTSGFASIHEPLTTSNTDFNLGGSLNDGAVFAETQTVNGEDAGNVILDHTDGGASTTGSTGIVRASFDEESGNGETNHRDETVGLVGFELGTIPCFTPGTAILTPHGQVDVGQLEAGMSVLTRDHGPQVLRWVCKRVLSVAEVALRPRFRPVRICAGALGAGLPEADLVVSPQHRVLVTGWKAQILFGEEEIFVPAKALLNDQTVTREPVTQVAYIHLLFDRHEVVESAGLPTESLHGDYVSKELMGDAVREEFLSLLPRQRAELGSFGPTARPVVTVREGSVLL